MADLVRFAQTLTGSEPDIFETVKRGDYDTEDSYIDALTQEKMKRSAPAYSETRRQIVRQLQEQDEAAQRKAQREQYDKIRSGMRLDAQEQQEIAQQAEQQALDDYRRGRLSGSLHDAEARYQQQLEKQRLDSKATAEQFNQLIRGGRT